MIVVRLKYYSETKCLAKPASGFNMLISIDNDRPIIFKLIEISWTCTCARRGVKFLFSTLHQVL